MDCPTFKDITISERRQFVKKNKLYCNFKAVPKNSNQVKQYARLCHFDFNYIKLIDQFLVDVTDFHYAFSDTV